MANITDLLAYQLGALEQAAKALLERIHEENCGNCDIAISHEIDQLGAILSRRPEDWQRLIDEAGRK